MVSISRQCPVGADKAVQISWAGFFIKGHNRNLATKKHNLPINQDVRSSLCLGFFSSNFLKIAKFLNVLCTRNGDNVS